MPKIRYESHNFTKRRLAQIAQANAIIAEYRAQGFVLTLRQLYYQFVSRDLLPNTERSYQNLGRTVNDGRMAGLIDWAAIEDRTRWLRALTHWESPAEIVDGCAEQYRVDRWANQRWRPEVWIEKDALIGVIEGVCEELDVPYFACRGYASVSELWRAGMRHAKHKKAGQRVVVFHLGDHDPSGVDMTRDIRDRLATFGGCTDVRRLALNREQVEQYDPPPNPAKLTDSRVGSYLAEYGDESWELDALEPSVIAELVSNNVRGLIDAGEWEDSEQTQQEGRERLAEIAEQLRAEA